MTVYIITKQAFPNGMAATNRIICYAKAILSQGIRCKVLIFTRTEVYGKEPRNTQPRGNYDGIEYEYMGNSPIRGKYSLRRKTLDWVDQIHLSLYILAHIRPNDIVISFVGRDTIFVNSIIRLTHLKKAKFIRELCELPYGTGMETSKTLRKREYTFKKQFPLCDGIIAISDALYSLAKKHSSPKCQIIKIPILVDYEKYYMEDLSQHTETPYIFHSGTLYEQKDGFVGMLEAFGKASKRIKSPIRFISTGTPNKSPHYEEIKRILHEYHIEDKVTFTGYLSNDELKDYLSKSSLTIINKYPNQQNTYCFSTKLGEYLAAGKPVIITKVGEAKNWLKDGESAYIIEPNDPDLLADKIINAFHHTDERIEIGTNGQKVCKESFDYMKYGKLFTQYFHQLV